VLVFTLGYLVVVGHQRPGVGGDANTRYLLQPELSARQHMHQAIEPRTQTTIGG
jgi:hypothetical protein